MDLGIKGKIALVSAASQGLGKAAALSLAKEGATVAICSRDERSVNKTAKEIHAITGSIVLPVVTDVSNGSEINRLIDTIMMEYGKIDILVNNAGGPSTGKITTMTDVEWERGFDLTMRSMIRMTRAVLPMMEHRRWGRVITIASITAKQPVDDLLISSTLRPGILGLTKVLANQYGKNNITVNTICPGYVLTQRQEELSRSRSNEQKMTMEEYLKESAQHIPVGRLGRPEEIGDVIAFLASERASFINGANLMVDGGQSKAI
ncbi:MAG: SDR family oxidoreductase [Bacteriovoracaceae bacterium]